MGALDTIIKAVKVPDIRKKIIFTLLMIVVFRLGANVPVPGIDRVALQDMFSSGQGLFEIFDLFSGGNFSNFTIFALSITPYITASIILNLLTIAIPALEALSKEGMEGRKKIAQYTRYLTVALAFLQAIGLALGLVREYITKNADGSMNYFTVVVIIMSLTGGTAFLMWLGEQINEYGVGNGISLIIFAGIICRAPAVIGNTFRNMGSGGPNDVSFISLVLFALFALFVVMGTIMVQQGQRRIPVQYAKRVVGRKMYGGQNTHIPIKVNQAGVIPVIFAMSLLQFPMTITYFMGGQSDFTKFVNKWLSMENPPGVWVYVVIYVVLTIFFTYFYTAVTFNVVDVSDNMRSNGGFIPGIRPGRTTVEYLNRVMTRVTFVGAVFLAAIAALPFLIQQWTNLNMKFGGTALLIVVGVGLDTMKQLENQMVMRNYKGFL
ncbi:MAG: preprotein translocase subunit SecY [Clostridiales Family XIII bacterium]|jgi:preprotein translocase subunit SecY|nr:preprotein translocase subunit SecY [Clostridiales Family XIII bacterium]